jgi:hypothetical protein
MKFKAKRAKVNTPSSLTDTIDVILRLTQVVELNVKEGRLATIAAGLSREDAQALQDILSRAADTFVHAHDVVALAHGLVKRGPGRHTGTRGDVTITVNVPAAFSVTEENALIARQRDDAHSMQEQKP